MEDLPPISEKDPMVTEIEKTDPVLFSQNLIDDYEMNDFRLEELIQEAEAEISAKEPEPVKIELPPSPPPKPILIPGLLGKSLDGKNLTFFKAHPTTNFSFNSSKRDNLNEGRLATPIYQILQRLDTKNKAAEILENNGFSEELNLLTLKPKKVENVETDMWVDKYAPKKFTDLLTLDSCNLEVLKWVKQWDYVDSRFNKHSSSNQKGKKNEKIPAITSNTGDIYGRPEKKILLLHGQPGLGKTTLAHIVAKVAGYSVVEINASDERTGNSVINKVSSALQVKSVLEESKKPNLIVIDEIDGAAAGGSEGSLINYLVKLATTKASEMKKKSFSKNTGASLVDEFEDDKFDGNEEEKDDVEIVGTFSKATGNRKNKGQLLIRPIICICNDLFVPALRSLRQVAHIVTVKPISPVQLSLRLKNICEWEGLKINSRTLVDLAESMDSDIRSTLHALQFLSQKQQGIADSSNFNKELTFGAFKDSVKSPITIYESIFQNTNNSNPMNNSQQPNSRRKYSHLLDMMWTSGVEYDKVMTGCFELYPQAKYFDNRTMDKVNQALETFGYFDLLSNPKHLPPGSNIDGGRLSGYLLYQFAELKNLFASPVGLKFKFPKQDYESYVKLNENQAILKEYIHCLPVNIRSLWSKDEIVTERLSSVFHIIQNHSEIKSTNPKLMKPNERAAFDKIVNVMSEEGMMYRQVKLPDNATFKFVLDPPIDQIIALESENLSNNMTPQDAHSYALCRLITAEIENLHIKKQREKIAPDTNPAAIRTAILNTGPPTAVSKRKLAEIAKETAENIKLKKLARDFFGRPIAIKEPSTEDVAANQGGNPKQPTPIPTSIWYVHNDGVSNAVRRSIKVKNFLFQ